MEDERQEELETLASIYPELIIDPSDAFSATLELPVSPASPLLIRFAHLDAGQHDDGADGLPRVEHELSFSHLPPFTLHVTLPSEYPENSPPAVKLSTQFEWLPTEKISELELEVVGLWEECGRSQILFGYIDHLQQAAERGFDLGGCLTLSAVQEFDLATFNSNTVQEVFNTGTYDCGICLDPKKGTMCMSPDDATTTLPRTFAD